MKRKKHAPFQGEIMRCEHCHRAFKSDPHVESNWTAVEIDGKTLIYICPECWGNEPTFWRTHKVWPE